MITNLPTTASTKTTRNFTLSCTPKFLQTTLLSALFFLLLGVGESWGQASIANYVFTSNTSSTLEDLSTGATNFVTGNNDTYSSSITAIGFDLFYGGSRYTHFSINADGQVLLHTSATTPASAIGTTSVTIPAASTAHLCLM
jgi:hypothetical protein